MDSTEFETKALEGLSALGKKADATDAQVKAYATKQDELITNFDRLDASTKKIFDEVTTLKNKGNDLAALEIKISQALAALRNEQRMAFGDPIQRIARDEELRTRFNVAVRLAIDSQGDMRRLMAPQIKAIGEDAEPGSAYINDALEREIYDVLAMYGVWNSFAVRRVGTKTTKFPVKTARAAATFILTEGTGQIGEDSTKAGSSVSATLEVIAALLSVSLQLLQDSEFDVTADVLDDFAEAIAYKMDWACLQADGTADATDGGMTGIFAGGTAVGAASGNTTIETTDFEDWTKCLVTIPNVLNRACKWWMHPSNLVRALSVKDSNGRPIFLTALEAPTRGGIGSILGYPVVPCYAGPSTNTASSKVAVFGDPNGQVVALGKDFTFEASDHHKWDYLQRCFRGHARFANKIRAAGAFGVLTLASS